MFWLFLPDDSGFKLSAVTDTVTLNTAFFQEKISHTIQVYLNESWPEGRGTGNSAIL